ncbi:MAG: alpha/beta hydrolase [Candidatus Dormibacteraceae bacterium]
MYSGVFKRMAAGLLAVGMILLAPGASTLARADQGSGGASCQGAEVSVPVALLLSSTMHGTLCLPSGGQASTVMVLIPGATYNQAYWNFPYEPQIYNFRQAMNRANYATFVVDRMGTGESSKPLSALLTADLQAAAVHAVIQELRDGEIGGHRFNKVIVGGHSLGSAISILEAANYHDVDGVFLSGFSHKLNLVTIAKLFLSFQPAPLDPDLDDPGLDVGYLTTKPGTRGEDFYYKATENPKVVDTDEATKDVWSTLEAPDSLGFSVVLSVTHLIKVPVLIANGGADNSICTGAGSGNCASAAAFRAQETPFFSPASCLQTYLLADSGHDVNLATDTPDYQKAAKSWADRFVGSGSGRISPPRGACSS